MKVGPPVRYLPIVMDLETGISMPPRESFAGLHVTDRAMREEILHRAYAIWESEGGPENRELNHWLEAEADVLREA